MINQIKKITLSTGTWLLMKVPADACEFAINKIDGRQYLTADKGEPEGPEFYAGTDPLPAGHTYTLIGLAKDLTEDQWKLIVERSAWKEGERYYRDYRFDDPRFSYETAAISGLSLLIEHKAEPDTTVILKQND